MKGNKGGKKGAKGGEPLGMSGKGSKGENKGEKVSKGGSKGTSKGVSSLPCAMKFLAPEALASAVIGKGGSVISEMRSSCDVRIAFTRHDELYPKTDCRVVTVQANQQESLDNASKQIVAKVKDVAAGDSGKVEGELYLRTLVPFAAAGGVIGKGGTNIKQIREATGAKISIDDPIGSGPGADQVLSITGNSQALEDVLLEVNKQIQLVNQEPWFTSWASNPGAVTSGNYWSGNDDGYYGENWSSNQNHSGLNMMWDVASGLPPYVLDDERGFAMSCVVPNHLCGGLIGRGGSGTKEVQAWTGTKIAFREIPDDPENRSLQITGPLMNTCTAYMMMMRRYLDVEASSNPEAWK